MSGAFLYKCTVCGKTGPLRDAVERGEEMFCPFCDHLAEFTRGGPCLQEPPMPRKPVTVSIIPQPRQDLQSDPMRIFHPVDIDFEEEIGSQLTWPVFKKLRERGVINTGIDNSVALRLLDALPIGLAHIGSWACLISVPAFLCISVFYKWWVGLILLFTVTPAIFKWVKRRSAIEVLKIVDRSEKHFTALMKRRLLMFEVTRRR